MDQVPVWSDRMTGPPCALVTSLILNSWELSKLWLSNIKRLTEAAIEEMLNICWMTVLENYSKFTGKTLNNVVISEKL